jgi:hypothetical protein
MELVWLSHGGGSMEAEQVRDTMKRTGRRLGVANTNLLMSESYSQGLNYPVVTSIYLAISLPTT